MFLNQPPTSYHGEIYVLPVDDCWKYMYTPLQAWHICSAGFRCVWSVGVELAARLPEGSGSRQGRIQEALKGVLIPTLLMHAAH